jgi:hypothetical protein
MRERRSAPPIPSGKPGWFLDFGIEAARLCPESMTATERRKRPRYIDAVNPAGPAPTMTQSYSAEFTGISDLAKHLGKTAISWGCTVDDAVLEI